MENKINTKTVGRGIAKVEDFILSEEKMSRLIFRPQIHNGGIRGRLIRQRRESEDDVWNDEKSIDIRTLGKNETINIDIPTEGVLVLYKAIRQLATILREEGVGYGDNSYKIVDDKDIVITDDNKKLLFHKLSLGNFTPELLEFLSKENPELIKNLFDIKEKEQKEKVIQELKDRLDNGNFLETSGSGNWQDWIYKNNWLFGANYDEPIQKQKISISGIMPDYLFPTFDGFVDILEIKLPKDDVIKKGSHVGSWVFTEECNQAVGQVINYLNSIGDLRLQIEEEIKSKYGKSVSMIKPRGFILIGDSRNWSEEKKKALRKINGTLHGVEIITYNDLLIRGTHMLNIII